MKKKIALLLGLILLLGVFVGCETTEPDTPDGMKVATIYNAPYRLFIPTTWTVNTGYGVSGGYFSLTNPSSVTVRDYDSDETDMETFFVATILPALEEQLGETPDYTVEATVFGEEDARNVFFDCKEDETEIYRLYVLCRHEGKIYVLSYRVTKDLQDTLEEQAGNIVSNFRFDEPYIPDSYQKHLKETDAPDGWQVASDRDSAFVLFVPTNWTINLENAYAEATSPDGNANVSLIPWAQAEDQMRISDYFPMVDEQLTELFGTDYVFLSDLETPTEKTMAGKKAYFYEYTVTTGGETYRLCQLVTADSGIVYPLTLTAKADVYDDLLPTFLEMGEKVIFG